jgi:hypothetical protein
VPDRRALLIGSYAYPQEAKLQSLRGPPNDIAALDRVLASPDIGSFVTQQSINESSAKVREHIEGFLADRQQHEVLLLYFSGHGIRDYDNDDGSLYLAATDTRLGRLWSTAVKAFDINQLLHRCRARQKILILDCCHSGAFAREGLSKHGIDSVRTRESFADRGLAVLTACDAYQYAFEDGRLQPHQEVPQSFFTRVLVEGLATGSADRDGDGWVTFDELYDHVFEQVQARSPSQTPRKWTVDQQGRFVIARGKLKAVKLPEDLSETLDNRLPWVRKAAIDQLLKWKADHTGRELAARQVLERLCKDDSDEVKATARLALQQLPQTPADKIPALSTELSRDKPAAALNAASQAQALATDPQSIVSKPAAASPVSNTDAALEKRDQAERHTRDRAASVIAGEPARLAPVQPKVAPAVNSPPATALAKPVAKTTGERPNAAPAIRAAPELPKTSETAKSPQRAVPIAPDAAPTIAHGSAASSRAPATLPQTAKPLSGGTRLAERRLPRAIADNDPIDKVGDKPNPAALVADANKAASERLAATEPTAAPHAAPPDLADGNAPLEQTQPIAQVGQKSGVAQNKRPGAWADPDFVEYDPYYGEKFWFNYREAEDRAESSSISTPQLIDGPHLQVISGMRSGLNISLTVGPGGISEWTVGSQADREVRLQDTGISALHAKIVNEGHRWKVIDQMSAYGTFINGKRSNVSFLSSQDRLRFGPVECIFYAGPQAEAPTKRMPINPVARALLVAIGVAALVALSYIALIRAGVSIGPIAP